MTGARWQRVVTFTANLWSAFMVVIYAIYEVLGRVWGLPFAFFAIMTLVTTYTVMAVAQWFIAHELDPKFRQRPVPFRWVMFCHFLTFSLLLWWIVYDYFWPVEDRTPHRIVWLLAGLSALWFLRRYLQIGRYVDARAERITASHGRQTP